MTDLELYGAMRKRGFTDLGANEYISIKNNYPSLFTHYNEYMGNFGFTDYDLLNRVVMLEIKKYMANHNNYVLVYQECEDFEWWLTPIELV